jgi:transcriptional antiterminator RfaH
MDAHWYAFYSKPMKEALLWEQLKLHQIESYYPCLRVQPVNPRSRKVKPYFPRYVFGRISWEQFNMAMLQWMPGVAGIVSFGGIPSQIPDNLIAAVRRRVEEINATGSNFVRELKTGTVVIIQDGPFKGYEALFDAHTSGEDRVRVFLKLLSRQQIPLELPGSQIQRKKQ